MDLKTLYRQNFLVLCHHIHQRREVLSKNFKGLSEDGILKLSNHSIHLLKKTKSASFTLYHIRVIDTLTDKCILQGPVALPEEKQASKKAPSAPVSKEDYGYLGHAQRRQTYIGKLLAGWGIKDRELEGIKIDLKYCGNQDDVYFAVADVLLQAKGIEGANLTSEPPVERAIAKAYPQ